jgi:hypothetical protein
MSEWREYRELEDIERELNSLVAQAKASNDRLSAIEATQDDIAVDVSALLKALVPPDVAAQSLILTQEGNTTMGVITGIKPGATAIFDLSTLPVGSLLQAGSIPTYTQDNTTDVSAVVPAADGMSFSVTGAATFTAGAVFNVTANAVSLDGVTKLSQPFNIPLLAPAGVAATGLDLNQRS